MKKFIYKTILFLLLIGSASLVLDFFLSYNLKKSNSYAVGEFPTWNDILKGNLNSDILVYGSSRAWVHFDPEILEDSLGCAVYNLGIDGHHFYMEYLRHILTMKQNKKPKEIIFSLDYSTLQKEENYNNDQFLPYMLWNYDFYKYASKIEDFSFFDFVIPLVRYYGKTDAMREAWRIFKNPNLNERVRIKGYNAQDLEWMESFSETKKVMNNFRVKIDKDILLLLNQFLQECQSKNIKIVMVYPPFYYEGKVFVKNYQEVLDLYKEIATKNKIEFYDFSNDSLSFSKEYFYNSNHLNEKGSKIFSKKIAHLLKK